MAPNKKQVVAKHPNSRKVLSIAKKAKQKSTRDKAKLGALMKQNLLSEKLLWFQDYLLTDRVSYTKKEMRKIIELYLSRFDEEVYTIQRKTIGCRKNQITKREEVIKMTLDREKEEYYGGGLEIPDLMNASQLKLLREWDRDIRFLSLFKLKRYSKKFLSE